MKLDLPVFAAAECCLSDAERAMESKLGDALELFSIGADEDALMRAAYEVAWRGEDALYAFETVASTPYDGLHLLIWPIVRMRGVSAKERADILVLAARHGLDDVDNMILEAVGELDEMSSRKCVLEAVAANSRNFSVEARRTLEALS